MGDPRAAAAKLALVSFLEKRLKEWKTEAQAELGELVQGERAAAVLNGTVIGHVTKAKGRRKFHILNETGLTQWVQQRWPNAVITQKTVVPAFRTDLESKAFKHGALIDDDGEVCPHVEVVEGDPYLVTKTTDDAGIVIHGLLRHGRVGLDGIEPVRPRLEVVDGDGSPVWQLPDGAA